jgi:hypothetical protein
MRRALPGGTAVAILLCLALGWRALAFKDKEFKVCA